MRKSLSDYELALYKKLGVEKFKKYIIGLKDSLISAKYLNKPKKIEEYKKKHTNYSLGTGRSLDDLRKHKKELFLNGSIHAISLLGCISILLTPVAFPLTSLSLVGYTATVLLTVVNTYCIMLQRYNWVRINKVIKKHKPTEIKKKKEIRKELKEKDKELSKHKYKAKVGYKKLSREREISFTELINKATLTELKTYRKKLLEAESKEQEQISKNNTNPIEMELSKGKYKTLKLELTPSVKNVSKRS